MSDSSATPTRCPPELCRQAEVIAASYSRWLGCELVAANAADQTIADRLFAAPIVIVSHGIESDPILNFANAAALQLWETDLPTMLRTPSRLTAEPVHRDERARMLQRTREHGYIDDYQGVRISLTGRRFRIRQALVWNLVDDAGAHCGQAATFATWDWL